MNKEDNERLYKPFNITSVCRKDLIDSGYMTKAEALKMSDEDMERIARRIEHRIMPEFWETLSIYLDK